MYRKIENLLTKGKFKEAEELAKKKADQRKWSRNSQRQKAKISA